MLATTLIAQGKGEGNRTVAGHRGTTARFAAGAIARRPRHFCRLVKSMRALLR